MCHDFWNGLLGSCLSSTSFTAGSMKATGLSVHLEMPKASCSCHTASAPRSLSGRQYQKEMGTQVPLCSRMMQWKVLEADTYPLSLDMDRASCVSMDCNVHILRSLPAILSQSISHLQDWHIVDVQQLLDFLEYFSNN